MGTAADKCTGITPSIEGPVIHPHPFVLLEWLNAHAGGSLTVEPNPRATGPDSAWRAILRGPEGQPVTRIERSSWTPSDALELLEVCVIEMSASADVPQY